MRKKKKEEGMQNKRRKKKERRRRKEGNRNKKARDKMAFFSFLFFSFFFVFSSFSFSSFFFLLSSFFFFFFFFFLVVSTYAQSRARWCAPGRPPGAGNRTWASPQRTAAATRPWLLLQYRWRREMMLRQPLCRSSQFWAERKQGQFRPGWKIMPALGTGQTSVF